MTLEEEIQEKQIADKKANPNLFVMAGHHGTGKTTLLSYLPKNYIIDFEDRSKAISGNILNVKKLAAKYNQSELAILQQGINFAKKKLQENDPFNWISFDTMTSLQRLVNSRAIQLYHTSLIGAKRYEKGEGIKRDIAAEMPKGAGYRWLHLAYHDLMSRFDGLTKYGFIYVCHTKQASLVKREVEIIGKDIDLTGTLKYILLRNAHAAGTIYRNPDNPNERILDFVDHGNDEYTKASCDHLYEKVITISEFKDGEINTFWERIFPGWIKNE